MHVRVSLEVDYSRQQVVEKAQVISVKAEINGGKQASFGSFRPS